MKPDDPRIEAWLTGRLPSDELPALQRALADPALAEAVIRAAGEQVALRAALRGQDCLAELAPPLPGNSSRRMRAGGTRSRQRPRRSSRGPVWAVLIAAACLVVAFALWQLRPDPTTPSSTADAGSPAEPPASELPWRVLAAGSLVRANGDAVAVDALLPSRARVRAELPAQLRLAHRSHPIELELDGPFQIALVGPDTVACDGGTLRAAVGPRSQGASFSVITPHARCRVLGTRFTVTVAEDATRVSVDEGRVAFARRTADGSFAAPQPLAAGMSANSADPPPPVPLLAYPLHRGPGSLDGTGTLERILPLTLRRPPQWTDAGLLLDARNHCVTRTNAPWPELHAALLDSRAVTFSLRALSRGPPPPNLLLGVLYIRMPEAGERRLVSVWMSDGKPGTWARWSVTVTPDGTARCYRGDELLRENRIEEWPPQPDDLSVQLKLLMPLGHHGDPDEDLAVEFADVLLFDRVLEPDELRRLGP
ncbi:MAG: FecR domain-containing protein [Planctomycetota bacterium]